MLPQNLLVSSPSCCKAARQWAASTDTPNAPPLSSAPQLKRHWREPSENSHPWLMAAGAHGRQRGRPPRRARSLPRAPAALFPLPAFSLLRYRWGLCWALPISEAASRQQGGRGEGRTAAPTRRSLHCSRRQPAAAAASAPAGERSLCVRAYVQHMPSSTCYIHTELHADTSTDVHSGSLTATSNAADVSNTARVTGPIG